MLQQFICQMRVNIWNNRSGFMKKFNLNVCLNLSFLYRISMIFHSKIFYNILTMPNRYNVNFVLKNSKLMECFKRKTILL